MTIEQRAIKEYGTTDSAYAAGYILPEGQMLDFSEGGGGRTQDHRNVCQFFRYDPTEYAATSKQMIKFMRRGNIRVMPESCGIEFAKLPTNAQYRTIKSLCAAFGAHNMMIERTDKSGYSAEPIGDFYDFREWLHARVDYTVY